MFKDLIIVSSSAVHNDFDAKMNIHQYYFLEDFYRNIFNYDRYIMIYVTDDDIDFIKNNIMKNSLTIVLTSNKKILDMRHDQDNKVFDIVDKEMSLRKGYFSISNYINSYMSIFSTAIKGDFNEEGCINHVMKLMERYNKTTRLHIDNVEKIYRDFYEKTSKVLNKKKIPDYVIHAAVRLHDIGKLLTPLTILDYPGKLNYWQFKYIERHTEDGVFILKNSFGKMADTEEVKIMMDYALYHHEKYDGTGYPRGIKSSELPLGIRALTIVDVFEALISQRPYKKPMQLQKALKILREGAGTHFDPDLVEIFCRLQEQDL